MKFKIQFLLLYVVLLLMGRIGNSQTVIKVKCINSEPDSIKVCYHTNFYQQSLTEIKYQNKSDNYEFKLPKIHTQVAYLLYNTDTIFIWLNQQSSIELNITKNYLSTSLKFNSTDNMVIHNYFKKFPESGSFNLLNALMLNSSIDDFEMYLFNRKKEQENWLSENASTISNPCSEYLKKKILFQYWAAIYAYPIIRANQNSKELTVYALPQVVIESFPKEELKNQNHFIIPEFIWLLKYYITYESLKTNDFRKFTDYSISLNRKLTIAKNHLKGEVYALNYGQFLLEMYPNLSKPELKQLLKNFSEVPLADNYYKFCNDYIKTHPTHNQAANNQNKTDKEITFNGLDGKTHALSELKGKVVYVDFWASWCGPCRAMFPFSKQLYESLSEKEKKQIVFLYINIDADMQSWKKAILDNSLKGTHWHSAGNWQSEAVKYFKINSIPRYMIINKNGEIVDFNAKRPTDADLINQLRSLIKE